MTKRFKQHYMYREIVEGALAVKKTIDKNLELAVKVSELIRSYKHGFITGSGTSFHASLLTQILLNRHLNGYFMAIPSSEFTSWVPRIGEFFLIGFSQSGESKDTIEAIKSVMDGERLIIGVTNTPESTLTKLSKICFLTEAGVEKAIVATKTFDAQITVSLLLSLAVNGLKEMELIKSIPSEISRFTERIDSQVEELSTKLVDSKGIFIIGCEINYPIALEAGLKFKEAAMIHSEGFASREFLHGPIQLIDEKHLTIVIASGKTDVKRLSDIVKRVRGYGGKTLALLSEGLAIDSDWEIVFPEVGREFSVFFTVKAIQLLAYYLSVKRGLNPDKPTKLTKVVK